MTEKHHGRRSRTSYFSTEENCPSPLTVSTSRRVRFEEIDPLRIVWHGRHVSYFEDGRVAFGRKYGLSYTQFMTKKIAAPIVQLHIDYMAPLTFDQEISIETTLHWCEALKLNFEFKVKNQQGMLAATGYTVQLITDLKGNVLFLPPDWIAEFRENWLHGRLLNNES